MEKEERGIWYSKHMETAIVIPLILLCQDESQRETSSRATSDTSGHFMLRKKDLQKSSQYSSGVRDRFTVIS